MAIKLFIIVFLLFLVIDYIWIGFLMKGFYFNQLGKVSEMRKRFSIPIILLIYALLSLGITLFVYPVSKTYVSILLYGALFGLIAYGTYDLTSYALFAKWTLTMTLIDMAWGSFLCGIVCLLSKLLIPFINKIWP